ncbi:Mariner Mos1 transposase, partial [Stegodyphus mimosarum]
MSEMQLSRYQIKTIIYFPFCYKKLATECHQIMYTALGTDVVSYDAVKVWYRKFKSKDYDIQEAEHSGRHTDAEEASLQEFMEEHQYATTQELAKELDVSAMFISRVTHRINVTYKFSRWVPHELPQADKDRRVRACTNLLEYQRKNKVQDKSSLVITSGFTSTTQVEKGVDIRS